MHERNAGGIDKKVTITFPLNGSDAIASGKRYTANNSSPPQQHLNALTQIVPSGEEAVSDSCKFSCPTLLVGSAKSVLGDASTAGSSAPSSLATGGDDAEKLVIAFSYWVTSMLLLFAAQSASQLLADLKR